MANEIGGVLMLTGALGTEYLTVLELIHTLTGIDAVAIRGGQGIGNIPLPSKAVAAVLRLAVNGVARNADDFLRYLLNK